MADPAIAAINSAAYVKEATLAGSKDTQHQHSRVVKAGARLDEIKVHCPRCPGLP